MCCDFGPPYLNIVGPRKLEGKLPAAVDHAALKVAATSQEDVAQILMHLADYASRASFCAVDHIYIHSEHCTPRRRRQAHADGQQCGDIGRCQLHPVSRVSAVKGYGTELPEVRQSVACLS